MWGAGRGKDRAEEGRAKAAKRMGKSAGRREKWEGGHTNGEELEGIRESDGSRGERSWDKRKQTDPSSKVSILNVKRTNCYADTRAGAAKQDCRKICIQIGRLCTAALCPDFSRPVRMKMAASWNTN